MKNVFAFFAGLLAAPAAFAVDYTAAATSVTATTTDAGPIMLAVIGVVAAFWGFRKIKSLIGR
jgi:peptidoglycan/LPS O-acetylase OafA/YrhL